MGGGTWTTSAYASYTTSCGRSLDELGFASKQNMFVSRDLNPKLNPKNVIRECCDSEEHPNTIPIILALDVTGSMGDSCERTAQSLGAIMTDLYKKYKDIQFLVMGIGDLEYDDSPIQASQYESDIRIAEQLDQIYLEKGGGGNRYESYTAAWYFGLHHTKLDCWNRGKKGIIITMGDEPMNPYLPHEALSGVIGDNLQGDVETKNLYEEAKEKFEIYHIAVDDKANSYDRYAEEIKNSFGNLLGDHLKVSSINGLNTAITSCIDEALSNNIMTLQEDSKVQYNESGDICW